jgi:hypothetical protein
MAKPPIENAINVPKLPASVSHTPVIKTQLQPIMAPKARATTSLDFSTFANLAGFVSDSDMRHLAGFLKDLILRVETPKLLRKFTRTRTIALL